MSPVGSSGKKVGLVLSGGAARGLAHVGVLRVLHHEKIPIDIITGTSSGAVVGAAYSRDQDINRITRDVLDTNWKTAAPLFDVSFPKTGLLKGRKIRDLIAGYVGGNIKFSDLKIPFACVATDIDTGEEVVIDSGSVPDALRASISVPGIFTVVKLGGRNLVDGGLTTPLPVEIARRMGADFIIAVNVNPHVTDRMRKKSEKEPNIFQVLLQSIYIATYSLARNSVEEADIVIEPNLRAIGATDFQKARLLITRGRQAARSAIPEIKRKLAGL
ncbi:MAG TPA: patatin-like phospholipase family protein [Dehalococcoidales bacterium]|nr:patatin-like phospholipase family protein [Dehalococcoidales bacterium]